MPFRNPPQPNAQQQQQQQQSLDLSTLTNTPLDPYNSHHHDHDVQTLYTTWITSGKPSPPPYNPSSPPSISSPSTPPSPLIPPTWSTLAAPAWLLAHSLPSPEFERYCLAQLILHCGTALFGPWALIEAQCPTNSSIRRFANHWIAWNVSFLPPGFPSEYTGLYASTLVDHVVRNETHDPRTFDLEHWFLPCGDGFVADTCAHDPAVVRARARDRGRLKRRDSKVGLISPKGMEEELGVDTWGVSWRLSNLSVRVSRRLTGRISRPLRWVFRRLVPYVLGRPLACSAALFLFTLILTAILAGVQLGSGALQGTPGVRKSNVGFTMAVVLLGVGQLFFGFCTWRFSFIYYFAVFNVWAFANGVTWAVDGRSCRQFLDASQCTHVTASAVFVLLCIPFSVIHMVFLRKCNRWDRNQASWKMIQV